jgi:hypothetical protein
VANGVELTLVKGFWTVVNFLTDGLLLSAFALRIAGIVMNPGQQEKAQNLHFKSFQILSCVAPLIWIKLVCVSYRTWTRADVRLADCVRWGEGRRDFTGCDVQNAVSKASSRNIAWLIGM